MFHGSGMPAEGRHTLKRVESLILSLPGSLRSANLFPFGIREPHSAQHTCSIHPKSVSTYQSPFSDFGPHPNVLGGPRAVRLDPNCFEEIAVDEREQDLRGVKLSPQKEMVRVFYKELWDRADKTLILTLFHSDFTFRGSLGPTLVGHSGLPVMWIS